MATCLKEVDQNKKLANAASFVMKHLHRMKVPRKQEHLLIKIKDRTNDTMTSLRYGCIFCLEIQKIDGTEYLMGSTELAIF